MKTHEPVTPKVLLITNVPTPYRLPLFDELHAQFAGAGVGFKVVFGAAGYERRQWEVDLSEGQFDHAFLSSRPVTLDGNPEHTTFSYRGLWRVLGAYKPDVIIAPGYSLATVKAYAWSRWRRVPYLIWSGSVMQPGRMDAGWRLRQRRWLLKHAAGAVAYGTKAKEYFQALGMPAEKVHIAVNTVDVAFFQRIERCPPAPGDRKVFTTIGYLSPRKHLTRLLEAVRRLAAQRRDFVLEVIGDGEDRPNLEAYVARHQLEDVVTFHGYRQKEELPAYLSRSCGFLFQTDFDIWGLVLNEAMAAGLPCLASVHAGATHDLIEDGRNGFAVDFADTEDVVARMNWILDHPAEAAGMGQNARGYLATHAGLAQSAAGFVAAVQDVFQRRDAGRVTTVVRGL